jgi:hypothetical protein
MDISTEVGKLMPALHKATKAFYKAGKDSNNPFFGSAYSDLSSIMSACRDGLQENGLMLVSSSSKSDKPQSSIIETTLYHTSGEFLRTSLEIPMVKNDPQALGSSYTYARRYNIQALLNIITTDDDGETAMFRGETIKQVYERVINTMDECNTKDELTKFKITMADDIAKLQKDGQAYNDFIKVGKIKLQSIENGEG